MVPIHQETIRYLSILDIFFAEKEIENRIRKHLEGCIGWHLRNNHPEFKVLYPDDNWVGTLKEKNRSDLVITATEEIKGLDSRIPY